MSGTHADACHGAVICDEEEDEGCGRLRYVYGYEGFWCSGARARRALRGRQLDGVGNVARCREGVRFGTMAVGMARAGNSNMGMSA